MIDEISQLNDIEEAKIIISLKNDEINSLSHKMKTIEKKSSIKVSESNYKIQQTKIKVEDLNRKLKKMKEEVQFSKNKYEEKDNQNEKLTKQLKQKIAELQNFQQRKIRQHNANIFIQKLNQQKIEQVALKLQTQLYRIHKYFNPVVIIHELKVKSLEEIPTYLQLYHKLLGKDEQIKHISLQMQRLRSQTVKQIQQSFCQLNSYEEVMSELHRKNDELENDLQEKQHDIKITQEKIEDTTSVIEEIKAQAQQNLEYLIEQNNFLRNQIRSLESYKENLEYSTRENQKLRQIIVQFEKQNEERILAIEHRNIFLQQEIEKLCNEIQELRNNQQKLSADKGQQEEFFNNNLKNYQKVIDQKQNVIQLLKKQVKQMEHEAQQKEVQVQRHKQEINGLIKMKRKVEDKFKEMEELFEIKVEALNEQIQLLRLKQNQISIEEITNSVSPTMNTPANRKSLERQILQEQHINRSSFSYYEEESWRQMYKKLAVKHNQFTKKVYVMVDKIKKYKI